MPAGVLGEAWRGGPQTQLSRLLKGCRIEALSEGQARAVGVLAARSGLSDTVDLAVVEGALRRNDAVTTSNPTHIEQVADAVGRPLREDPGTATQALGGQHVDGDGAPSPSMSSVGRTSPAPCSTPRR